MAVFGVAPATLLLFVGFGLLVGTLFGFFGTGSFLVPPALLVLGYPAKVAVGSGLAFIFGTAVIAALKHRDQGQIDFKLGGLFIVGMAAGIEVGKEVVLMLEAAGMVDAVVSVAYILMLAAVGSFMLYDARTADDEGEAVVERLERLDLPPTVSIAGGAEVSLWPTFAVAVGSGILSGFLGVGGGFLLMPVMLYGLGVPAAVAVGTDVFQITASGAFGAFVYARQGAVDLSVVMPLLAGSALGARIGAAATSLVEEDEITGYFAAMLLAGAAAVATKRLGTVYGVEVLGTLSVALLLGAALLVSGAIVYASVERLREEGRPSGSSSAAD